MAERGIVVDVGQIWERKSKKIKHRIKLLAYTGDDVWEIEFIAAEGYPTTFENMWDMMAHLHERETGANIYKRYILIDHE